MKRLSWFVLLVVWGVFFPESCNVYNLVFARFEAPTVVFITGDISVTRQKAIRRTASSMRGHTPYATAASPAPRLNSALK